MTHETLSFGCALYDRLAAIKDGRATLKNYRIDMRNMTYGDITAAAFENRDLDIAEVSIGTLVRKVDEGVRAYQGIPIFLSQCFRHDCIYVRFDSKFESPEDLAGKCIGVPEFHGTTAIWLRGMMQDLHGIDFRHNRWVVGPVEGAAGVLTRRHPDDVVCDYLEPGACLVDLLLAGGIDAVYAHRVPAAYFDGRLRMLYGDLRAAETTYYRATGHIPLLHVAVVKNERLEADPELGKKLLDCFTDAKNIALRQLQEMAVYSVSLPNLGRVVDEARGLIGADFWPYGIDANRSSIDAFLRYSQEQGLSRNLLRLEDVFAQV